MKIIYQQHNQYILKLTRGEQVVRLLLDFCTENNISAGWMSGLGAVDEAEFSYYDLAQKEYIKHTLSEECELLSLHGNIAVLITEPVIHAHIVLGKNDYSTVGGHLHEMRVSGTCEIHLTVFDTTFEREKDEDTGLNLLK